MATHHGMKALNGLPALCHPNSVRSDRFGRMFTDLPALYIDPRQLHAIGAHDGPMRSTGPAQKTTSVAVGQIFFGQFVDHDVTLDLTSSFSRIDTAIDTRNFRTPTLDLDCVYGDGPEGSPYLYWHGASGSGAVYNGIKLLTGADTSGATPLMQEDLPRSAHGRAVIGDPRNDENRLISQLQLGFLRFHNHVAEHLHGNHGLVGEALAHETRRVVTWHYQWVVVQDFLRTIVGGTLIDDILGNGRRVYRPEDCQFGPHFGAEPYIPVEFAVAAYRFGHSMIPQRIQVRAGEAALEVFGPTLGFGFTPLDNPKAVVQWPQLLDLNDATVDRADKLDVKMAADLLNLPFVPPGGVASLVTRNLLRGQAFRLPSGEAIAARCGRPAAEIALVTAAVHALGGAATPAADLRSGTPLWLYIVAEAGVVGREGASNVFEPGEGLGPVGGRLVAETMIGLLELDSTAYLGSNRNWSPIDGADKLGANGVFTLLDLLTF